MLSQLRKVGWSQAFASARCFSSGAPACHGGLQDKDRIFTNIYGEHDIFINGAMKRGDWYRCARVERVSWANTSVSCCCSLRHCLREL